MPQGGIDEGESPLAGRQARTLRGDQRRQRRRCSPRRRDWLSYDLPGEAGGRWRGRYRGQTQKWFLFRLHGPDSEIDIHSPAGGKHAAEFREWRWERWEALPDLVVPFKRDVYVEVVKLFAPIARGVN